jgi:hypothetical protein
MNKAINQLRLFLCTFSGEDDFIIRRCPKELQLSFVFIGLFVMLIFVGCFISATTFTFSLFDGNPVISTPFGIFWASMIILIYLLLLYTITPPILPNSSKGKIRNVNTYKVNSPTRFFTFSMISRIGFMLLLAIIIAQPLSVYFLSKSTLPFIERYKLEQKARMIVATDSLLIQKEISLRSDFENKLSLITSTEDIEELNRQKKPIDLKIALDTSFLVNSNMILDSINKLDKQRFITEDQKKNRSQLLTQLSVMVDQEIQSDLNFKVILDSLQLHENKFKIDFKSYVSGLSKVIDDKISGYYKLDLLLDKSNFYLQKISILLRYNPISWFITLFVCVLFLVPIYLKFIVRKYSYFYDKKEQIERKLVIDAYQEFKKTYAQLLGRNISTYNQKHHDFLKNELNKIKDINSSLYNTLSKEVEKELKDDPITVYEHWSDCPFNTQKKYIDFGEVNDEEELLKLLYSESE